MLVSENSILHIDPIFGSKTLLSYTGPGYSYSALKDIPIHRTLISDELYEGKLVHQHDSFDPTVTWVNNVLLSKPDIFVGIFLLFLYVIIELLASPITILRELKPISYQVVRSSESSFAPALEMGYTFRGNYVYPGGGLPRMHYLDEGNPNSRHILVLIHGEPFWSQSWIRLIPLLTNKGFRVIAPDLIGFGKSDKYVDYRVYNTSLHKEAMTGLLNHLGLHRDLVLVGHNWGWMVGAGLAKDNPNLFKKFVILNTNNVPDGEIDLHRYSDPTILPRFSIMNAFFMVFQASVKLLREWFPLSLLIKSLNINYSLKELKAFMSPHNTLSECGGTTAFPLMVPVYPSHPEVQEMREIRHFLLRSTIPSMVAYSEASLLPWISQGDFVVGNRVPFYADVTKSNNRVHRIKNGGHLIMYDQPEIVANLIINFVLSSV